METPNGPLNFVPAKEGEILKLANGVTCRILEDGSRTAIFTLPPHSNGPPPHWHEMHDETFLVTSGTIRFHIKDQKTIDAKAGDYLTVGIRAPHTFSNPFDEEAEFFNTFTPAFYINYFKLMVKWAEEGTKVNVEMVRRAQMYFATVGVEGAM